MAKLFPFKRGQPDVRQEPRLVNIDDESADQVFAALSSDTARNILRRLYEEPATASDVADAADTSLQNARYHLDKLQAAGLVEDVDTWYSSRGTEMTVYAPTSEPLVVAAGREESKSVIKEALTRVLGAVAVLAIASVVVDRVARLFGGPGGGPATLEFQSSADSVEMAAEPHTTTATPTPTPEPTATPTDGGAIGIQRVTETAVESPTPRVQTRTVAATGTPPADPTAAGAGTATPEPAAMADGGMVEPLWAQVPPGALFFAGGLLVIVLVAGWWYWTRYRPLYG